MIFEATKVTAVLSAQSVYVGIHEAGVPSNLYFREKTNKDNNNHCESNKSNSRKFGQRTKTATMIVIPIRIPIPYNLVKTFDSKLMTHFYFLYFKIYIFFSYFRLKKNKDSKKPR